MAGLTTQMPPAAPAAPPTGAAPTAPAQAQQAPSGPKLTMGPVDPELMKKFTANCMNVVTDTLDAVKKTVSEAQDKVEGLAQATAIVVIRVEDSLEQSGQPLNLNMTFEAGSETAVDIADAMDRSGVYTYSQGEIEAGFIRAVDQYRVTRSQQGRLDPAVFKGIIQEMKQAEQDGTLEDKFPGLGEFAQKTQEAAARGGPDDEAAEPAPDDEMAEGEAPAPGADDFPPEMLKKESAPPAKKVAAKLKPKKGGI